MNDRRLDENEFERLLDILENAGAEERDEEEADAALHALIQSLPPAAPLPGFSRRVISAVNLVPLPAGRKRLHSRRPALIPAVAATSMAAAVCILWSAGLIPVFVAHISLALVQAGVLATKSVTFILSLSGRLDLATRAASAMMNSTEMLSAAAAVTVVSLLAFAALTRVISSSHYEDKELY